MVEERWGTLIAGGAVCLVGVVLGARWKTQRETIEESLDPLKDAVDGLHSLMDEYIALGDELVAKYLTYEEGGSIDWADVDREKTELSALEGQITVQVGVIEELISG